METQVVTGELVRRTGAIPLRVFDSSRYSLYVRLQWQHEIEAGGDFDDASLWIGGRVVRLGKCRFLPILEAKPPEGRLIFLDEQYELGDLLANGELKTRDSSSYFNIPLILSQKDRVRQRFKEYSANLNFEISVYKQFFDDIDRRYAVEPENVRQHLQSLVIAREGQDFLEYFGAKVEELIEVTAGLDKEQNDIHGFFFRKQVWDFILHSRLLTRTNLKPKGYAGDYEMLRMIYENQEEGASIFAKLMQIYPLRVDAAQAVRNRRTLIPRLMRQVRAERGPASPFRVMSVACGQAVEVEDFFCTARDADGLEVTLFDQDSEALLAARRIVGRVEGRLSRPVAVRFMADSVRTILRARDPEKEFGEYDFIYSMGLFDYLTPPVAKAVFRKLFRMLRPGGHLIIGNYHTSNPDRIYMEYWMDWVLYYRTEDEMIDLTEGAGVHHRNLFFEETGSQMFLQAVAP